MNKYLYFIIIVILLLILFNYIYSDKKISLSADVYTSGDDIIRKLDINKEPYPIRLGIQTVFILKENIPFLREWIVYHINLGFSKIFLYDNTGSIGADGSNTKKNKYNLNFNDIINENTNELQDILETFKNYVIYIKWQPKNNNGDIIYGQNESIEHYIKNYSEYTDYTAYIDIDEFIFSPDNIDIKKFVADKQDENISKIIIYQKKFIDRYCTFKKKVIDMYNTIENLDTTEWAPKLIIKNKELDLNNNKNIHSIGVKSGNTYATPLNILRFNHYNINKVQIEWMYNFFNKQSFDTGEDKSMVRYKEVIEKICQGRCSDKSSLINFDIVQFNKSQYCYFYE